MSKILTCPCGAKVRMPASAVGKSFRCPRCKADMAIPDDVQVLMAPVAAGSRVGMCPICQTEIVDAQPFLACPGCEQVHHHDCWQEVGGCSTYGCERAPAVDKETPASVPRTAWGDTKECPACGETIKSIALRCRYCGTDFNTVDPLTVRDLRSGIRHEGEVRSLQTTVIVLFLVSLSGCLAPISLIISPIVYFSRHKLLVKAGPFYQVLAYSTMGLSVLYSVLMVLFAISSL